MNFNIELVTNQYLMHKKFNLSVKIVLFVNFLIV